MEPVMEVLEKIGYQAENLPTGCCGMAGSFGYENEQFEISQQIGEMVLFPRLRSTPGKRPKYVLTGFHAGIRLPMVLIVPHTILPCWSEMR